MISMVIMMMMTMFMTMIPLLWSDQAQTPPALFVQLLLSAAPVHQREDDDDGKVSVEDDHDVEKDDNSYNVVGDDHAEGMPTSLASWSAFSPSLLCSARSAASLIIIIIIVIIIIMIIRIIMILMTLMKMMRIKPELFSVGFPCHQPFVLLRLLLKISLPAASLLLLHQWS